jgi:hypothetical protein
LCAVSFKLNVINFAKSTIQGHPIPNKIIGEGNGKEYTHSVNMYVYIETVDDNRADE